VSRIPQSVPQLATGWTVWEWNAGAGEIFRTCPDRPWDSPSLLYYGYRVFPGSKERPGRDNDPSPLLLSRSRKSRAISLLPLWAVRPVELQCLYKVRLTLPFTVLMILRFNIISTLCCISSTWFLMTHQHKFVNLMTVVASYTESSFRIQMFFDWQ